MRVIELPNVTMYTRDPDELPIVPNVGDVVEASNGFFVITNPETGDACKTTRRLVDLAYNYTGTIEQLDQELIDQIVDMVLSEYDAEDIRCMFEYDGLAKRTVGYDFIIGDYDVQVIFDRDSDVTSTQGMPKRIGQIDGLNVEVMRNRVPRSQSLQSYANSMSSKRWMSIRENPKLQLYPEVKVFDW